MNPHARPRNTESTGDVLAYPPEELRATELFVYAHENGAPIPGDVAAFGIGGINQPNADGPVGSSTVGALIIYNTSSENVGTQFATFDAFAEVVVNGPEGAEVGLLLFVNGQFDRYAELRVVIGSSGAGKIFLRQMVSGLELDRWSAADYCESDDYDIPPSTDITLRICSTNRAYHGANCYEGPVLTGTVTNGATVRQIGKVNEQGALFWHAGLCIASGSGVTYNDFVFEHSGLPDCTPADDVDDSLTCTTCDTCNLIPWGSSLHPVPYLLSKFTVVSGTWTISSDLLQCSTSNSTILLGDAWVDDNLEYLFQPGQITGTAPYTVRYLFSYVDADHYWCIEASTADGCRLIEKRDGETVHFWAPVFSVDSFNIYACSLVLSGSFGATSFPFYCVPVDGLNHTGQIGFATKTISGPVTLGIVGAKCPQQYDGCDDVPDVTDPGPGDPTACCSDLATIEFSDTIEATITGASYWIGPGCDDPDCTVTSDYLTDLNATHVLRCIYKSAEYIIFYANLGIPQPCERPCTTVDDGFITIVDGPGGQLVELWVWVYNDGMGNCQIFGRLSTKCHRCATYFESTSFAPPGACETFTLAYASGDGDPGNYNCCMQMSGATIGLNFP